MTEQLSESLIMIAVAEHANTAFYQNKRIYVFQIRFNNFISKSNPKSNSSKVLSISLGYAQARRLVLRFGRQNLLLGGQDYCFTARTINLGTKQTGETALPWLRAKYNSNWQLQAVVCLRGGERGTCLGPPLWGHLRCYAQKFLIFGEKLILHPYNVLQRR